MERMAMTNEKFNEIYSEFINPDTDNMVNVKIVNFKEKEIPLVEILTGKKMGAVRATTFDAFSEPDYYSLDANISFELYDENNSKRKDIRKKICSFYFN